jgi:hypothetical protein
MENIKPEPRILHLSAVEGETDFQQELRDIIENFFEKLISLRFEKIVNASRTTS